MKKLIECEKGERVKVIKLNADHDLKQRLISFGVMKGASIQVVEYSLGKKTVEVKVGKMRIALRAKEAQMIEVEKV
ncbi:MAG TPA: ferrous iron transport protein A [Sulfurimonas autotrophica]|nr:ferrous iron transport protein A [Sulfurimonas autotrophica]